MRKKMFIVLDTETANSVAHPLPYDFGWVVVDKHGNIYKTYSFVIYEIYCEQRDMMKSAYYADKLPQYEEDIKNGKRKIVSIWTARKIFIECMKEFNVDTIYAYNMGFDKRALNNDIKFVSSWMRWFFPKDTNFKCIWHMACSSILNRTSYIKFAEKNNFISAKGNILTNAEVCYKYITKNVDFKESHTGLEDTLIESAILAYCFRQHKKFDDSVNSACWRKVQKKKTGTCGRPCLTRACPCPVREKVLDIPFKVCYYNYRKRKEKKNMRICFDMDGTIANLYGVENWLDYLINKDTYPYTNAKVLLNMNTLARYLNRLQKKGFEIGIISWLAKNSTSDYDRAVTIAKQKWLAKHLKSVNFNFIEIVSYGYAKENFCFTDKDILFDDEERNRNNWTGKAYDEKNILETLKNLLDN